MCQVNVIVEQEGVAEPVMEGVARLEVSDQGILLQALLEEPKLVSDVMIKRIDFQTGKVLLTRKPSQCS